MQLDKHENMAVIVLCKQKNEQNFVGNDVLERKGIIN